MISDAYIPANPHLPTDADTLLAREASSRLAASAVEVGDTVRLHVEGTEAVIVPAMAFRLLTAILSEMAAGSAVAVVRYRAEVTPHEAADLLNVSRSYVHRLLDEGRIPSRRTGARCHVLLKDLLAYRAKDNVQRRAALGELTRLSQEVGEYDP